VAIPANQLNPARKEWTKKEPLGKIKSDSSMKKPLIPKKIKGSSTKNKKCKFKRPKIDKPPKNLVINIKSLSMTSWTKIDD
jgi:hypothetical protein